MLSQPGNKPVLETFSLKGKIALVTGEGASNMIFRDQSQLTYRVL